MQGTSSLQFDQVMHATLADVRPSLFGSLLTSKKSAKEIKTYAEYANAVYAMDAEDNSQVIEPKLSLDAIN
ncbi:hypothetical protein JCM5296_003238, partial [Sporobolomyces johnsonii]